MFCIRDDVFGDKLIALVIISKRLADDHECKLVIETDIYVS